MGTVQVASLLEKVMRYHERTKHHFACFAPGPGQLDWANQPDPFRRFEGAPLVRLPLLAPDDEPRPPAYQSLYSRGAVASVPVDLRALSRLLEYALALSAWKQAGGTRWPLRVNPSSGNLHPTEGYVLAGGIAGLGEAPGLFHYAPREHGLERRADCPPELFARLVRGFAPQAFLVGLSSVYWREAWKYGERAFRYCQHDAGHAIGALRIAAATLGWSALVLDEVADETIEALLGLDRAADFEGAEREAPELVMAVWPGRQAATASIVEVEAVQELRKQRWYGKANRLSADDPVRWNAIDEVAAASRKA
jgi:SagB-type dehydrogenase family enzyme